MDAILRYTAAEINEMLAKLKAGGAVTPSGDPQHYAYEEAGAKWNAATGCWEIYDMTDVTNQQMRRSILIGRFTPNSKQPMAMPSLTSAANVRFNLPRLGTVAGWFDSFTAFSAGNYKVEVLNLTGSAIVANESAGKAQISGSADSAFSWCENLRLVMGVLDLQYTTSATSMFYNCSRLEIVYISGLKISLSLANSPLAVECATYLLQNADTSATFSVTFRADRQAIYEANADFVAAKNARTNITILYQ